ncbi:hypothetical protein BJF79_35175 [Actinomadura sp. CNU-125]|nr:hypothetical protein BJF79_35175 [Actinomadura sp. CNU-125]
MTSLGSSSSSRCQRPRGTITAVPGARDTPSSSPPGSSGRKYRRSPPDRQHTASSAAGCTSQWSLWTSASVSTRNAATCQPPESVVIRRSAASTVPSG